MMSLAANQSWKGHSCGLVLKLLHSCARWVRSWQGGPVWLGANICPKHPVWPCESSLAVGKLSHLAQVSGVPWKGASENGILFSHCSSLDVLSHGGPGRGENWTRTGQVQKKQPLSWPHVSMKFTFPLWPPRGEEKQSGAGPVPICCHLHHLCTSSGPEDRSNLWCLCPTCLLSSFRPLVKFPCPFIEGEGKKKKPTGTITYLVYNSQSWINVF